MANFQSELVGPWNIIRRIPQIALDFNNIRQSETTGQDAANVIPDPNLVTTLIITDEATMIAIEADSTYDVYWSEEIIE